MPSLCFAWIHSRCARLQETYNQITPQETDGVRAVQPETLHMPQSTVNTAEKRAELRRAALEYHEFPTPGKLAIAATKQLTNQRDLALAYSPGVAAPCEEIVKDPNNAFKYTARGNLVAVITNGTAVLGLGPAPLGVPKPAYRHPCLPCCAPARSRSSSASAAPRSSR